MTLQEECMLKSQLITNSENKLQDTYKILTIMVVINVVILLVLIYTEEETKIYKPKYEYLHYDLEETNGKILLNILNNKYLLIYSCINKYIVIKIVNI